MAIMMIDDNRNKSLGRLLTIRSLWSWLKYSLWFMVYGQMMLFIKSNDSECVIIANQFVGKNNLTAVKSPLVVDSRLNSPFLPRQLSTIKITGYNNNQYSYYINDSRHKHKDAVKSQPMKEDSSDAATFDADKLMISDNKILSNNCVSCADCVESYPAKCIVNGEAARLTNDLLATALNANGLNSTEIALWQAKQLSKGFQIQNPLTSRLFHHRYQAKEQTASLSRRKRYLSFPQGALLTVRFILITVII